jgi:hypothetical protein
LECWFVLHGSRSTFSTCLVKHFNFLEKQ